MPPAAVKTVKDLIFWEYAKLISGSAIYDRKNYGFVMDRFKKLQSGGIKWSQILREDLNIDTAHCTYKKEFHAKLILWRNPENMSIAANGLKSFGDTVSGTQYLIRNN